MPTWVRILLSVIAPSVPPYAASLAQCRLVRATVSIVMPGFVPDIHVLFPDANMSMAGTTAHSRASSDARCPAVT
jgi:hypothetical protein